MPIIPRRKAAENGIFKGFMCSDSHSAQASTRVAYSGWRRGETEGNTPAVDCRENKGLERQKKVTDDKTDKREIIHGIVRLYIYTHVYYVRFIYIMII